MEHLDTPVDEFPETLDTPLRASDDDFTMKDLGPSPTNSAGKFAI